MMSMFSSPGMPNRHSPLSFSRQPPISLAAVSCGDAFVNTTPFTSPPGVGIVRLLVLQRCKAAYRITLLESSRGWGYPRIQGALANLDLEWNSVPAYVGAI